MSKTARKRDKKQFRRHSPPGTVPGSLVVPAGASPPIVRMMAYAPDQLVERELKSADEALEYLGKLSVVWINVDGFGDAGLLKRLSEIFHLHPLAVEDAIHVHQRPKVEEYAEHLFIVTRMVRVHEQLETEQVSMFVGKGFIITVLEDPGDCFDAVRQRIRGSSGKIRSNGAGYLAYALLDVVIDNYFPVLEQCGDRLDAQEQEVITYPEPRLMARIYEVKRDLRTLRRAMWPQREALHNLGRDDNPFITENDRLYLRDCYDHSVQILDLIETYRELCADMTDLYLSSTANRLNEVMKVLTIIATIFMPLSFIAGVYGMNFNNDKSPLNMPELSWYFGYPFALLLMASVAGFMIYFFYRRGWVFHGSTAIELPPKDDATMDAKPG